MIQRLFRLGAGALSAQQGRAAVTQHNLANATTPGYRRQRVGLETVASQTGLASMQGVALGSRESVSASAIERQVLVEQGRLGYQSARAEHAQQVEATWGSNTIGLTERIDQFFNSAQALAARPSGNAERRDFLANAEAVSETFGQARSALEVGRENLRQSAQGGLDLVNTQLEQIAQFDRQIAELSAAQQHAGDLIDARDRLVGEVVQMTGARVVPTEHQTLALVTDDGRALVEGGRARQLGYEITGNGAMRVSLRDAAGVLQPLSDVGGTLGAMVQSDEELFGQRLANLDQASFDFTQAVNARHRQGFGTDGQTGRPLFEPLVGVAGAASAMSVSTEVIGRPDRVAAALDSQSLPGGNGTAQALIEVRDLALSTGQTLHDVLISEGAAVGRIAQSAKAEVENVSVAFNQLQNLRDSITGVSLEEEMMAMTQAQRAFQGAARLIEIGNEMYDTILTLGR